MRSTVSEYGTCACGGTIKLGWVEVRMNSPAGDTEVIPSVPRGRCPSCASAYYKAWTLQVLEVAYKAVRREVPDD